MTEIFQALALELDKVKNTMWLNTEEMLYEINKINNADEEDEDEDVIISQDFDRMYPSLHIQTLHRRPPAIGSPTFNFTFYENPWSSLKKRDFPVTF